MISGRIWEYNVLESPLYQTESQAELESLEEEKCTLFAAELKRGEQIVRDFYSIQ